MQIRWETVQTGFCRYTELIRLCFQHKWIASLGAVSTVLCTPLHYLKRGRTEERKREKFYIYSDVTHTHTHPAGAGSTLKGKRKKTADTNDGGPTTKTAQGGEGNRRTSGTNLHGETT